MATSNESLTMKKIIFTLLCSSVATPAWCDILGFQAAAGQWYINLKGDVGQNGSTTTLDDLGFDNETSNVFWAQFEHPLPIIPNIRLMHSTISSTETSTTTQRFTIGGILIDAQVRVLTDMDLSHTDATFYYEILDNWVTLDVGITARQMQGYMEIQSEVTDTARAELEGVLPMGYVNLQLDFPGSGWSVGSTVNAISYRGDKVTDVSGRIGYAFEVTPLMDIGVNIGYRTMSILAEEFDDLYADATISGSYAELIIRF
jgi:outer membrane protein